ncbi:MAG: hypothetical protein IKF90_17195 [Parasporobacterium sp.]|nr:hypothetical protein [Parasporobacterium sp.]
MDIINNPEMMEGNVYRTICFNCHADFVYQEKDVHHNHWLNVRVKSRGFRDFTGEVRCPSCGTFLPHYVQNQIQ